MLASSGRRNLTPTPATHVGVWCPFSVVRRRGRPWGGAPPTFRIIQWRAYDLVVRFSAMVWEHKWMSRAAAEAMFGFSLSVHAWVYICVCMCSLPVVKLLCDKQGNFSAQPLIRLRRPRGGFAPIKYRLPQLGGGRPWQRFSGSLRTLSSMSLSFFTLPEIHTVVLLHLYNLLKCFRFTRLQTLPWRNSQWNFICVIWWKNSI